MKSRIMFVSHGAASGGAENCLYSLLSEIDRQKYEALVVLPGHGPLEDRVSELGVETHVAELAWCLTTQPDDLDYRVRFGEGLRRRALDLADVIKSKGVDLVFTNSLAVMDGAVAAGLCGVPHVWHVLELLGRDPGLHPPINVAAFHHLVGALSDRIITVSESVKQNIESHLYADKITTVHTGIDLPDGVRPLKRHEPSNGKQNGSRICFVGNLSKRKGALGLVEAAPQLLNVMPNARFEVVGPDGGVAGDMKAMIEQKGITGSFRFLGYRNDPLDIIASSDLLVLPSVADPLPLVVLEAMLLGKPVVATSSGGASEMVVEGVTGCIVPVSDPSALASAIIGILKDPQRAKKMGEQGRERALTHFNRKRYTSDIEEILDHCGSLTKGPDPFRLALIEMLLGFFESAAKVERKLLEDERKAHEYDVMVRRIQSNRLFKMYHWLKYLGRV